MKFHSSGRAKAIGVIGLSIVASLSLVASYSSVKASDHDDGESDVKTKSLNLTDLFVFREVDQDSTTPNAGTAGDSLIFIMNTNPRSVARRQYYFNTSARYEFHINRQTAVGNSPLKAAVPDGDIILRITFGAPDAASKQAMTVSAIIDGATFTATTTTAGGAILTTPLSVDAGSPTANTITLNSKTLTIFAGLREDPFFFDVEQYHRVREGVLVATGFSSQFAAFAPLVGFRDTNPVGADPPGVGQVPSSRAGLGRAIDFAKGYNVDAIVIRVPRTLLQSAAAETVFDVWETTSI